MSSIGIDNQEVGGIPVPSSQSSRADIQRGQLRFDTVATLIQVVLDACTVTAGLLLAHLLYDRLGIGKQARYDWRDVTIAAVVMTALFLVLLDRDGEYRKKGGGLLRIRETERILRTSSTAFLLIFPLTFYTATMFSRWTVSLAFVLISVLMLCQKQMVMAVIRSLHQRGYGVKKILIYGAGYTGRRVLSALARSPKLGLCPTALVDDDPEVAGEQVYMFDYKRTEPVPVIPGPITAKMLRASGVQMLVVGIPSLSHEAFLRLMGDCVAAGVEMSFVSGQATGSDLWIDYNDIDGLLLNSFAQPREEKLYETAKRLLDLVCVAATLPFIAPFCLAIAVLVRMDSAGSVFYRQKRVGLNGEEFEMYKFRTMYTNMCGDGFSPTGSEDPRITRIGRYLRRTSLDELPQLLNVLKGDMSLVGPRPEMPFITCQYGVRERQRLQVKPGITGLWQLSADRAFLIHENLQYDFYYIRHRGFFMDLAILFHTLVFAMHGI